MVIQPVTRDKPYSDEVFQTTIELEIFSDDACHFKYAFRRDYHLWDYHVCSIEGSKKKASYFEIDNLYDDIVRYLNPKYFEDF